MKKRFLEIEAFRLDRPIGYEEIVQNADSLFAELLVRHYLGQKKVLTSDDLVIQCNT